MGGMKITKIKKVTYFPPSVLTASRKRLCIPIVNNVDLHPLSGSSLS